MKRSPGVLGADFGVTLIRCGRGVLEISLCVPLEIGVTLQNELLHFVGVLKTVEQTMEDIFYYSTVWSICNLFAAGLLNFHGPDRF